MRGMLQLLPRPAASAAAGSGCRGSWYCCRGTHSPLALRLPWWGRRGVVREAATTSRSTLAAASSLSFSTSSPSLSTPISNTHPRRSALYMPGSNPRALHKARSLPADCIIMDLEDAVAPDAKEEARENIVEEIQKGGYGYRELVIRVNGLQTQWGADDVKAAATSGADAVLLPKVESAEEVRELQRYLRKHGAPPSMKVWIMIETPLGVLNVAEICRASQKEASRLGKPGFAEKDKQQPIAAQLGFPVGEASDSGLPLTTLVMGFADLGKELHASPMAGRQNLIFSMQACLLVARAYRLSILDGVFLDLDNEEELAKECLQGQQFGMDGKTLIHPKQIAVANQVFAPSAEEVALSRRMISAHAEAAERGEGVVLLDGVLVENLHVANARRVVGMAEAITAQEAGGGDEFRIE